MWISSKEKSYLENSNQSILEEISPEYSLEGLMLKLKLPILWPPDAKNWLIWKDWNDWRQEEKGTTEDEMVGWHHQLNGHEFQISSGTWWWTGNPGIEQSMRWQRAGHDWGTELNYLLGIKYIKAHIKHSAGCVPIICSLILDPTLLSALLIPDDWKYLCSSVVILELHRSQVIHELWAQIISVGPRVKNQSCSYTSSSRM